MAIGVLIYFAGGNVAAAVLAGLTSTGARSSSSTRGSSEVLLPTFASDVTLVAMAFTALTGATDDVADVTLPDLGIGSSWEQVYRVRPRPDLRCRQCRHPMHAKVSPRGHRFFSHDTGADCASAGESAIE